MFHLDNGSGIDVVPVIKQTISRTQKWFTEGDSQTPPSYPGADWFNIVQAELLNVLKEAGIEPNKAELNQLSKSIKAIIDANKIEIHDASLTEKGIVNLSSAVDSASETESATPLAVKIVNGLLQSISAKIHCHEAETRVTSGDRQKYIFVRNDGVTGGVGADGNIKWSFDSTGALNVGSIHANNVSKLDEFVINMFSSASNENAGFLKMPNGLIIQWGRVLYANGVGVSGEDKSFYTAFPRVCLSIVSSDEGSGTNSTSCWPLSTTQFRCWGRTHQGSYAQTGIFYMAIGF